MSSAVSAGETAFESLRDQIQSSKSDQTDEKGFSRDDIRSQEYGSEEPKQSREESASKRYAFRKGDNTYEIDDDAEIEFMADKRPMRMSFRELRDRAAGDVAIKNRMHSLAEERKQVKAVLKGFASLSKDDPIGALEYIAQHVNEADNEFEYNAYLEKLADQAQKLSEMDEKEIKSWQTEKKLKTVEKDLSQKEREMGIIQQRQEILDQYPEIEDHEFDEIVEAVLSNDEMMDSVEDEDGFFESVENLIVEILTQRDILEAIEKVAPTLARNEDVVFALSDQLKMNPDFDEEDIRDVLRELAAPSEREHAARTLSSKQRARMASDEDFEMEGASNYEILMKQLTNQRKK